jgi:gamma-glutamyltranspeptidase/glutathione hydrolase
MFSTLNVSHSMSRTIRFAAASCFLVFVGLFAGDNLLAGNSPERANDGMVVSANALASEIGANTMRQGGNALDAAIATAFALAVTHPSAGNVGGGGFLIYQPADGQAVAYDFREVAPSGSHPRMWLTDGEYNFERHHMSHMAVGVPGTVAGLYMAWQESGSLPWKQLLQPAIELAGQGFEVTHGLARSLERAHKRMARYPASMAQFSKAGEPYEPGDRLVQKDLAVTLSRIADSGTDGFYKGPVAELIVAEMKRGGGLITMEDLANYKAIKREPITGSYRGYKVVSMPPPSSGGIALVQMLNILKGFNIAEHGFGSMDTLHLMTEAMRRAYADRARFLGDPDFSELPFDRLTSKAYAEDLRKTINPARASVSSPDSFEWPVESEETTHFSVVDRDRNAVALTYTLEWGYGSAIVVEGGGFLLNNEMGDFNAGPGLTDSNGLIGTKANLAEPGKRMLSSMTPTIVNREGDLFMLTGSPGGRTIINTVLQTILNVIDHGMNAQEAVDAGRIHHQWLPDTLFFEKQMFSPDTIKGMRNRGHSMEEREIQGVAEVIVVNSQDGLLEGGVDRRVPDGAAVAE